MVIDADYRNSIKAKIHNDSDNPQTINPQDRICQLIIQPYLSCNIKEVNDLSDTERGLGGFGSTGINKENK